MPMQHIIKQILILLLALLMSAASSSAQDKSLTPTEQFQSLFKEHSLASSSGKSMTDAERLKFVGQAYRHRYELSEKLLALAEKYPSDPIALEALIQAVWQVNGTPWPVEMVGPDKARAKAFEILQRDYITSEKLGPLCQRISYGYCKEYEAFLRSVLADNPHKSVQGLANLSLGQFLNSRMLRLDLCSEEPKAAQEFADLFGRDYLAELRQQNRENALKEIESTLEQAVKNYSDVKIAGDTTVAERAGRLLFEVRHLRVGKVSPDIVGMDQDGRSFKLSDYRGKVVLLDFWSYV